MIRLHRTKKQKMFFSVVLLLLLVAVGGAEAQCGNGVVNAGEQCDGGPCCTSACQFAPSSTVCRANPPEWLCGQADKCSGTSSVCFPAAPLPAGTPCRAAVAGDPCDLADVCDGASPLCRDSKQPVNTPCANRACEASSVCDARGLCTGRAYTCPCPSVPTPFPTPVPPAPSPAVVNCAGCGNAGYQVNTTNWCRCCGNQPACQQLGRANIYTQSACVANNGFCSRACLLDGKPNPDFCDGVQGVPPPPTPPPSPRTPAPTPAPTPLGPQLCDLDRNVCSLESCVVGSGCLLAGNAPFGTPCDDADACTVTDQCIANGRCAGSNVCPNACSGHGVCCRNACSCDKTFQGIDCSQRTPGGLLGAAVGLPPGAVRLQFAQINAVSINGARGTITAAPVNADLLAAGGTAPTLVMRDGYFGIESGDRCASLAGVCSASIDCAGNVAMPNTCSGGLLCCLSGNVLGALVNGAERLTVQFRAANSSALPVQLLYAELSGLAPSDRVSYTFTVAANQPVVAPATSGDAVFVGPARAVTGFTVQSTSGRGFSLDAITVVPVGGSDVLTQAPTQAPTTTTLPRPSPAATTTTSAAGGRPTPATVAPVTTSIIGSTLSADTPTTLDGGASTTANNGSPASTAAPGSTTGSAAILPPSSEGLGGGAIAGIIIGVLLGLCCIAIIVVVLLRRRGSATATDAEKGTKKPAETKPTETKPVETKPVETKPVEPKVEPKPVEPKPVEPKPAAAENKDDFKSPRDEPPSPKRDDTAKMIDDAVAAAAGVAVDTPSTRRRKRKDSSAKLGGGGAVEVDGVELTAPVKRPSTKHADAASAPAAEPAAAEPAAAEPSAPSEAGSEPGSLKSSQEARPERQSSKTKRPKPSNRNLLEKEVPPPEAKPEDKEAASGLELLLAGQLDIDEAFKTVEREKKGTKKKEKK